MRTLRVHGLALAALGGFGLGACNFVLGLADGPPGTGGGVGTGVSSSSSGSGASTTASSGGGDGGMEPDADAGVDAGPTGRGLWAQSYDGSTVSAIAAGPNGTLYLTGGGATGPSSFGCNADAGSGTGSGYLVQLDASGNCLWGFFFGGSAQGTGVAVDSAGDVVLTAQFSGSSVNLIPNATPAWPPEPVAFIGQVNSFVALYGPTHTLTRAYLLGDFGGAGDHLATAVAINDALTVAVAASYTSSIGVIEPPLSPGPYSVETSADGTDSVVLRFDMTGDLGAPLWVTGKMATPQVASAVALDSSGNVAVAGTTTGPTVFDTLMPVPAPMMTPSIFLASWAGDGGVPFSAVLGGDLDNDGGAAPQDHRSTVFDGAGNMLVGATFTGSITGVASPAAAGQSVFLGRYTNVGAPLLASLRFGSDTAGEDATLAGVATDVMGTGSVTFAGGFQGSPFFHISNGPSITTPVGAAAAYVAKVDSTLGTVLWLEKYGGGGGHQVVDAVAVDPTSGNVLVAGHYQGKLDFGGTAVPPLVNNTTNDELFVAVLSP